MRVLCVLAICLFVSVIGCQNVEESPSATDPVTIEARKPVMPETESKVADDTKVKDESETIHKTEPRADEAEEQAGDVGTTKQADELKPSTDESQPGSGESLSKEATEENPKGS